MFKSPSGIYFSAGANIYPHAACLPMCPDQKWTFQQDDVPCKTTQSARAQWLGSSKILRVSATVYFVLSRSRRLAVWTNWKAQKRKMRARHQQSRQALSVYPSTQPEQICSTEAHKDLQHSFIPKRQQVDWSVQKTFFDTDTMNQCSR